MAETLRSGWLTTGPKAAELERRLAEFLEAEHVIAVASGTAAMHLALLALDVGPGDEVITTPITWPATANVIVHTGATPVFADVRDDDLNIDPERVKELVTERTKAILPVHLAGPAVRPRAAVRARPAGGRGRGARARERVPRAQARRPVRRDVLLPLRDEERRRGRGRARVDESRGRRRGDPRAAADAARRRLALRHRRSGLQGEPVRRARGDRARPARQGRPARGDSRAAVRVVRRRRRGPRRDHAARARRARRARAAPLCRARRRRARRCNARRVPARARRGAHLDEHPLPARAPVDVVPRAVPDQPPLPVAERGGAEVLSLPLSPAHSDDDIRDAIDAVQRVHARFAA